MSSPPVTAGPMPSSGAAPPWATQDPTAIIGKRAVAKIIDTAIGSAIGALAVISLIMSFHSHTVADAAAYCSMHATSHHQCTPIGTTLVWEYDQPSSIWTIVGVAWWLFIAWLEGRYGWTPGKLALNIRVVRDTSGKPCGFGRSVIRNLLWFVDGLFFGLIAVLVAKHSSGHQRLGDRAAGTLVVERAVFGVVPPVALTQDPHASMPGALPADHPIWDQDRSAYIIWDTSSGAWLQWNAMTGQWEPIRI